MSSDAAGEFYARETLKQLAVVAGRGRNRAVSFPCCEIDDAPRYAWRGLLLDEGRHFFGKDAVRRLLDQMARHKLNVFHWHLTEDQGWRIDVPGYPELVKYGSVRPESPAYGAHIDWDVPADRRKMKMDSCRYGPFYYTESDLREIVRYAQERHITIVPEIELPGHALASIAAYPELTCFPERMTARVPRCSWGVEKNMYCAGNDKAIDFLCAVLDFVCDGLLETILRHNKSTADNAMLLFKLLYVYAYGVANCAYTFHCSPLSRHAMGRKPCSRN